MSSVFSGMVEPLPFVLASKVFVDADQYDFLSQGGDGVSGKLDSNLSILLHEFDNAGILAPISFRSLVRPKIAKLLVVTDGILDSDELPAAAAESRRLWSSFLRSPGASFIPNLSQELQLVELQHEDCKSVLDADDYPELRKLIPKSRVSIAALTCGHDVFDVVTMLSVASDLDAFLCDWHMYEPLYSLAIRRGNFPFAMQGGSAAHHSNLRWYVPIPRTLDIDHIWTLREDPHIIALRNTDISRKISTFSELHSPEAWRDLRRSIQDKVRGVILNPYNAYPRDDGTQVVTEALYGDRFTFDGHESVAAFQGSRSVSGRQNVKHRILFLAADPSDASRLRLGQEYREIKEKIRLSKERDAIELHQAFAVRPEDLSQAILDVEPTVIHFSGHGRPSGELCFESNDGKSHPISAEALASLFQHFTKTLQLVVLNACYSASQASAIARHVPFVVGMQDSIGDRAAVGYSIGLYQAIGAGRTVEDAHSLGCSQIRLLGDDDYDTPVLIKG